LGIDESRQIQALGIRQLISVQHCIALQK